MTVPYSADVANAGFSFLKLLTRWRGSIYKLLKYDFPCYVAVFYIVAIIYRFAITENQQIYFKFIASHCHALNSPSTLAFVLGFFISLVMQRWTNLIHSIPWPDKMAMYVTANLRGFDEKVRLMRRTIMRYLCLAYVITLSSVSPVIKKRFPKFKDMVDAGFMLDNELRIIEGIKCKDNKFFIPIAWCTSLVARARQEGKIKDDFALKTLVDEINIFRGNLGSLFMFDWIPLPLVYTQVVTVAVYSYFIPSLIHKQFRYGDDHEVIYQDWFPLFTFLEYFFYVGWLKVGESFINPFGSDDDDIDFSTLIDRNLRVSYLIVDDMHNEHPELIKDQYWDSVVFESSDDAAYNNGVRKMSYLGSALELQLKSTYKRQTSKIFSDADNFSEVADGEWRRESKVQPITNRQNSSTSDSILNQIGEAIFGRSSFSKKLRENSESSEGKFSRHGSLKTPQQLQTDSSNIEIVITEPSDSVDNKAKKTLEPLIEGDEHSTPPTSSPSLHQFDNAAGPQHQFPDKISF